MRAVVCGAGIAGLAAAGCLGRRGWEVVVLERAPRPREQGYMLDFFGPGWDAAEAMGVLPAVREAGYAVDRLSWVDDRGRERAGLPVARFAHALGGRLASVMRPDLERVLREHAAPVAELCYGRTVAAVEGRPGGADVLLEDGGRLEAELVIGADGIRSAVRRSLFGPDERFHRFLGHHAAAFLFEDPEAHRQLGNRFCLTDSIDRNMGFYGLRDGRVAAVAVHRTRDPALPADPRAALREVHGSLGWIVPRALAACPEPAQIYYDRVAQIEMPRWSTGRVVLLGDASQAVSLLGGQGASVGIAGAWLLAERLARATEGGTADGAVETALAGWEAAWRPVVAEKQRVARGGAAWFLPATRARRSARRLALRLAALPGFDRAVTRGAVGRAGGDVRALAGGA
ncbi:FAD-dependent oxidoreductase [Kocuria dechangensis]|uniref:FAD-dependent oxidoreductase n=1 Tax=Kocuria dechangensis TaxID=1176249 RepID=A0A917GRJ8_9MICC|nr:FAD-dependent monooxygenase [Kocuria dechangensis]GGG54503.1 FAD-dependent oxidoreductase [Kocuria dechangensis]